MTSMDELSSASPGSNVGISPIMGRRSTLRSALTGAAASASTSPQRAAIPIFVRKPMAIALHERRPGRRAGSQQAVGQNGAKERTRDRRGASPYDNRNRCR